MAGLFFDTKTLKAKEGTEDGEEQKEKADLTVGRADKFPQWRDDRDLNVNRNTRSF